jgi:hypothetical protein
MLSHTYLLGRHWSLAEPACLTWFGVGTRALPDKHGPSGPGSTHLSDLIFNAALSALQAGSSHASHATADLPDLGSLSELEERLEFERLGFSGAKDAPGSLVLGGWTRGPTMGC